MLQNPLSHVMMTACLLVAQRRRGVGLDFVFVFSYIPTVDSLAVTVSVERASSLKRDIDPCKGLFLLWFGWPAFFWTRGRLGDPDGLAVC